MAVTGGCVEKTWKSFAASACIRATRTESIPSPNDVIADESISFCQTNAQASMRAKSLCRAPPPAATTFAPTRRRFAADALFERVHKIDHFRLRFLCGGDNFAACHLGVD